jgi:adenosylmethionine-8-amino-7-oxononanoate aminotransferase
MALQLCPPLVVCKEEIDEIVTIVDESLSLAEQEFGFA